MSRNIITGILISAVTLALLTVSGEFLVRKLVFVDEYTGKCSIPDEVFHHRGAFEEICHSRTREWDVDYKLNSKGIRNPELDFNKPPDTYRILVLGDSYTLGTGVHEPETFPRQLEKILQDSYSDKKIQVINAGFPSYSPLLEYNYLTKEGINYQPDLVVLEFDLTDFSNDLEYAQEAVYENDKLVRFKTSTVSATVIATPAAQPTADQALPLIPAPVKKFLHENSKLYQFLAVKLKVLLGKSIENPNLPLNPNYFTIVKDNPSEDEKLWQEPKKNLKKISEFLKEKGIPFIVSAHPHGLQVDGREWGEGRLVYGLEKGKTYSTRYFDELDRFLQSENILFLNQLQSFKDDKTYPKYFGYDGHFNASAHSLVAKNLSHFIQNTKLLKLKGD